MNQAGIRDQGSGIGKGQINGLTPAAEWDVREWARQRVEAARKNMPRVTTFRVEPGMSEAAVRMALTELGAQIQFERHMGNLAVRIITIGRAKATQPRSDGATQRRSDEGKKRRSDAGEAELCSTSDGATKRRSDEGAGAQTKSDRR